MRSSTIMQPMTQPEFIQDDFDQLDPEVEEYVTKLLTDMTISKFRAKFEPMFQSKLAEVRELLNGAEQKPNQTLLLLADLEKEHNEEQKEFIEMLDDLQSKVRANRKFEDEKEGLRVKLAKVMNKVKDQCKVRTKLTSQFKENLGEIAESLKEAEELTNRDGVKMDLLEEIAVEIENIVNNNK
eukprot:TRINITY_DN4253_c3_g1_i1.p4 TRINITY_DN4253_c3_g1~~TRINITY_DN4253_c3_g1_i1.p4  ORF type:complete len:183 (+),score=37.15 TRINITY_DN4253_c3_g1_i1:110-658(+)